MKKKEAHRALKRAEKKLPYGAKAVLARKLRENRHNVQTAFRGMAGEDLTIKVYKKAVKVFPAQMQEATASKK